MKIVGSLGFLLLSYCCAACANASLPDTVVIGYPLDYSTTSALFPGLGEDDSASVVPKLGQTFTVPAAHAYLTTFSFWLSDSPFFQPQPTTFDAILMAYGVDGPVGPVIYQSLNHSTVGLEHAERRRFDFTVGTWLDPLASYVFFLDTVPHLDGVPSYALFASEGTDAYSDGVFVHYSEGVWQEGGLGWDMIFRAEFQNVPEPSSAAFVVIAQMICLSARRHVTGSAFAKPARLLHSRW